MQFVRLCTRPIQCENGDNHQKLIFNFTIFQHHFHLIKARVMSLWKALSAQKLIIFNLITHLMEA